MWKPRCMKLRSRWTNGNVAVDRQLGRELHGADQHQRRDLARAARHREDHAGHDARASRAAARCAGSSATCSRRRRTSPRASSSGTAASASSVATITTGSVSSASVSEAHRRPPVPNVGLGQLLGEERAGRCDAPIDVAEEAEAEDAEHDARHAGQVVDRDAHGADDRPGLRVLAQVERRQHAERHDEQRHEQRHHDGAEDRREDAALAVRLARLVGQELAPAREVDAELAQNAELVGGIGAHDVREPAAALPCPSAVAKHELVAARSSRSSASISARISARTARRAASTRSSKRAFAAAPGGRVERRARARPRAARGAPSSSSAFTVADLVGLEVAPLLASASRTVAVVLARTSSQASSGVAARRLARRAGSPRACRRSGPTRGARRPRAHSGRVSLDDLEVGDPAEVLAGELEVARCAGAGAPPRSRPRRALPRRRGRSGVVLRRSTSPGRTRRPSCVDLDVAARARTSPCPATATSSEQADDHRQADDERAAGEPHAAARRARTSDDCADLRRRRGGVSVALGERAGGGVTSGGRHSW